MKNKVTALITDFDGTLVDTFQANFYAYHEVLWEYGINLTEKEYRKNYGLRLDDFMKNIGITDKNRIAEIKTKKMQVYAQHLTWVTLNRNLYDFLKYEKSQGMKIAIASTASRANIMNVLHRFGIAELFDVIVSGEEVTHGKPNPEVYEVAIEALGVTAEQCLIFEDSEVGLQAADAVNPAGVIKVNMNL